MKIVCISAAFLLLCLAGAPSSSAQVTDVRASAQENTGVTGEFKCIEDVRMSAQGYTFDVACGDGVLKNGIGETIAKGDLSNIEKGLAIRGRSGASFTFQAAGEPFADDAFSKDEVTEFASVLLSPGNQWTLKDANFYFVVEIKKMDLTHQTQVIFSVNKSLARASVITLPKGVVRLWGYTITVEKETGTVKFAHGRIVEATDASYK
jgi:hypothetical protein